MKTCLDCMTTTQDNNQERCAVCGGTNFRMGQPKRKREQGNGMNQQHSSVDNMNNQRNEHVSQNQVYANNYANAPAYMSTGLENVEADVTLGGWMLKMLILAIPIVRIIYAIVGIASAKNSKTVKNYFKAFLIMYAIGLVIGVIASQALVSVFTNMMYNLY